MAFREEIPAPVRPLLRLDRPGGPAHRTGWKTRAILQLLGQMLEVCRYRSTLAVRVVAPDRCICNLQGEPADQTLVGFQPR